VLVAIGLRNRLVLVPAIEASEMSGDPQPADRAVRGLRRAVAAELVVFAALLLATATLVGRSPVVASELAADGEHATSGAGEPVTVPLSTGVGTVTITLDPGNVGGNMLMLTLTDNEGGPLALIEPPTVALREESRGIGPLELVPEEVSTGNYHAIADIPFAGTWEVSVQARTSTFDSALATTVFVVGG
jgi:copper transport protein